MNFNLARRAVAEWLGTTYLLIAVVGSGIMAERLGAGNVAIVLLANAIATGVALVALITTFGPISGAQLNPVITLSFITKGNWQESVVYVIAQMSGAFAGVLTANVMFSLPPVVLSQQRRLGFSLLLSELVATFGLVLLIRICVRTQPRMIALVVGAYITAAYWFTSSTSFANPAVTLARAFTATFTGIQLSDVAGFVLAQISGAGLAVLFVRWLISDQAEVVADG